MTVMRAFLAGGLLLLSSTGYVSQSAVPAGPIGFVEPLISEHRIGGQTVVEIPAPPNGYYGEVEVRVTISPEGVVTDAQAREPQRAGGVDPALAVAAAKTQRFRPFTYRGRPVAATGTISILMVPRSGDGWRNPNAAFPEIDYATLKITLSRSACYGACPDYRVTIDGAGNVIFSTGEESIVPEAELHRMFSEWGGVLVPGTQRRTIDRATVDALIARFRAARFFGLKREYRSQVTDNPTYSLRFETGGRSFGVIDYVGRQAGMPAIVSELERAVDEAAGTAQWVQGDARTVPALLAAGMDAKSEAGRQMALMATAWANERVAIDLIEAGTPLDGEIAFGQRREILGKLMLGLAAGNGKAKLLLALAGKGWLGRLTRVELDQLFASSGGACDPAVVRAMVAAGASLDARTPRGDSSYLPGGRSVLHEAISGFNCGFGEGSNARRRAMAAALLDLGVDVNAADYGGSTAIFAVEDPELLEMLLARGAHADIKDKEGNSAAMSSWTDVIVLRLLDAGADPNGFYDYGGKKTLRQMAIDRNMPATLKWLDANGVK